MIYQTVDKNIKTERKVKPSKLEGIGVRDVFPAFTVLKNLKKDYSEFLEHWSRVYSCTENSKPYGAKEIRKCCSKLLEIYQKHELPCMLSLLKYVEHKYPNMFSYLTKRK